MCYGRNYFISGHNTQVFAFPGTLHATFYLGHPPWGPEYESCRLLTMRTTPVFSYYSDLVICDQPEQGPVWSIVVMALTAFTVFPILGACRDGTVGFRCYGDQMCCNGPGFLGHPTPKALEMRQGFLVLRKVIL